MNTPLTWLYVPGDRPEVVAKALLSGADVVLVDLEDAVAPDRKAYARDATVELLADVAPGPTPVHVRINALDGPLAEADVRAVAGLPGLAGLRLPKANSAADVRRVARWAAGAGGRSGLALYPILESALGVERAYEIATATPTVRGLALGEADLRADLGIRDESGLAWPRSRAVVAARAAGLAPPAQSVFTDVRDLDGLAASCERGRALGFLGRAAIHPRQLPVIEQAYLPTPAEIRAAEDIVLAAVTDEGALALPDGRFVDAAVVAGARRTLELAGRRESA
ncbi:CoA ester lyase [Streptomyces sp. NBC_01387]|uniref:HpcH/HpaI aldolase/citrate lyase family protein n=1 Tax=unclassified Streptomyces TaxID=2593676 RepID=UPI002024CFE7|nr:MULTISPECIES: CoA ester lyase [unclassified Streptomyces]MCX4551695.1 CoA ester lyase [Streptomyces sp. NBC_01500]WSC23071.1 CoA ester lyase [Streptomyces sp. NBC_01766]WSV56982.1 CoA ester lyase [Streptomyces sp. NBC_01014]